MHYEVLDTVEYCIYGVKQRASKGNKVYIPVRSVAKELLRQKRIKPSEPEGISSSIDPDKKPEVKKEERKVPLREGSLVRVEGVEEIGTVKDILNKQARVEYTNGETKRVAISRIVEVID